MIIAVYVDDILAIGPQDACNTFADELNEKFRIVNQGAVSSFLGINVQRENGMILLNQVGYIDKMAQQFDIKATSAPTPLEHSLPLVKPSADDKRADPTLYKELTGSLNQCSKFFSCLTGYPQITGSNTRCRRIQFLLYPWIRIRVPEPVIRIFGFKCEWPVCM
jgi:hypothetical protein